MSDSDTSMNNRILCIGVGNEFRQDDGIGILIARHLAALNLDGVDIVEHSGEGASLMEVWRDYSSVILIDAVNIKTQAEAGTTYIFDANNQTIPADFFSYSTHDFSVAEAIALAKQFDELPEHFVVYGIVGKSFGWGNEISNKVFDHIQLFVSEILIIIKKHHLQSNDLAVD